MRDNLLRGEGEGGGGEAKTYDCKKAWSHKVRTYKEYHSVCPSSELGLPPTPHPQASVPPPPGFWGEGNTRWRERGWESPISDEGHTLWYSLYVRTLCLVLYESFNTLWTLCWNLGVLVCDSEASFLCEHRSPIDLLYICKSATLNGK